MLPCRTGQCLSYQNMADIVNFCREESLVLIADEVYQVGRGAGRCVGYEPDIREMGGEGYGVGLWSGGGGGPVCRMAGWERFVPCKGKCVSVRLARVPRRTDG